VLLAVGNLQEWVRLSGLDCPERGQPFSKRAKEALLDRVGGETVTFEWDKRDWWEPIVGKVIDREGDVNLVREGKCWWYRSTRTSRARSTRSYTRTLRPWRAKRGYDCGRSGIRCHLGCGGDGERRFYKKFSRLRPS